MGSLNLAYPKRTEGSVQEQLAALQRSMRDIIDQLNLADWSAEAILQEISTGINEDAALRTEKEKKQSAFASLKQLIIKTADFSMENSEQFTKTLQGGYVAKSTFGEYAEATSATIEINSKGITQLFDYTAGINSKDERYGVTSRQYVKTGLLYYDGVTPRYGVGVGNISTTVQSGNEVINTSAGEVVTVTPGEIKFWQQGVPVAWITDKVLHFPSGTLEALGAKISGEITATKLTISENAEISGLYLEKFKLRGNLPVYEASSAETLVGYLGVYVETYEGETNKQISLRSPNESMVSVSDGRVLFLAQGSADAESGGMRITPTSARIYTTDCGVELLETRDVSIEGDSTQVSVLYFGPNSSGDVRLGTGKRLWNSVWAVDDVIQTSDLNEKNSISYDMERYAALFDRLKPANYKLNAGTSGRVHVGMIAQDVEEAMTAVGLTGQEFAGICKAAKDEGGYSYFLRYGEFIALCIDQIQKLKTRIAALEGTT